MSTEDSQADALDPAHIARIIAQALTERHQMSKRLAGNEECTS